MLAPSDIKDKSVDSTNVQKTDKDPAAGAVSEATESNGSKVKVVYKFCDLMKSMIEAWKEQFKEYIPDRVQVRPDYQATLYGPRRSDKRGLMAAKSKLRY